MGSTGMSDFSGKSSHTQFREASCQITHPASFHGNGISTTTRRDTSFRYTGKITRSAACVTGTLMPVPPTGTKK